MRDGFKARQADEAARALDGVNQAENVVERRLVAGITLEAHKLDVDHVEAFSRFRQEFTEQIVHSRFPLHLKFGAFGK